MAWVSATWRNRPNRSARRAARRIVRQEQRRRRHQYRHQATLDTFGVTAEVTGGNYQRSRNLRLRHRAAWLDISAGRLYVGYQKRDGFLNVDTGHGPNTNDQANNRNNYTLRGQYLITPSDDIDILWSSATTRSAMSRAVRRPCRWLDGRSHGIINALASIPPLGGQVGAVGVASSGNRSTKAYSNQPWVQQIRDYRAFSGSSIGISASPNSHRLPRGATTRSYPAKTPIIRRSIIV